MSTSFLNDLKTAQGRSEFVIAVVADIRGFSRFSTRNESPNIAMFIKRFYIRLLTDYFAAATFTKPTGDGLLMTFRYDEESLAKTAQNVLEASMRCLVDFPNLCKDDPMINFELPNAIGFGIARGTACCLYSRDTTLDYSGHLLNLAARLNDLARPSGIVIDGAFLESVIPEGLRASFKTQNVFVRSIAETKPISVFFLDQYVQIPEAALVPLSGENWRAVFVEFTHARLQKLAPRFRVALPSAAKDRDGIRVTLIFPRRGMKDIGHIVAFKSFDYEADGPAPVVILHIDKVLPVLAATKTAAATKVQLKVEYIPKSLPRS